MELFRERLRTVKAVSLAMAVSLGGAACSHASSEGFSGGCQKYGVYAQNRWAPLGTAIRTQPDVLAPKTGGFAGDEVIAVNGWVHSGKPAYPNNTPPWNSDIWFHLANQSGWVSFAGVRAEPTIPDPTQLANGGEPALTPTNCEGTYKQ